MACELAAEMFSCVTSMPCTWAPMRARLSLRMPPPHPTSRAFRPCRGSARAGSTPCMAHTTPLMNLHRAVFMRSRGAKGPDGSHHCAESCANLAASFASTLLRCSGMVLWPRFCCWAWPWQPPWLDRKTKLPSSKLLQQGMEQLVSKTLVGLWFQHTHEAHARCWSLLLSSELTERILGRTTAPGVPAPGAGMQACSALPRSLVPMREWDVLLAWTSDICYTWLLRVYKPTCRSLQACK